MVRLDAPLFHKFRATLAFIAIATLLVASLPHVAAGAQVFDLTNASDDVVGISSAQNAYLDTNAGQGTSGTVSIASVSSVLWVPSFDTGGSADVAGTWSVTLGWTPDASVFAANIVVDIGVVAADGTFTSKGSATPTTSFLAFDVTTTDFELGSDERFGVQVTNNNVGTAQIVVEPSGSASPQSSVTTPDSAPDLPVFEFASIILLAAGLLVVATVVGVRKHRQNA